MSVSKLLFYCHRLQHWFWAAIPQILWHLYLISPESCRAARSCVSVRVQSSQSEGHGKREWNRGGREGDRMSLCVPTGPWDMQVFKLRLKEALEVKELFLTHISRNTFFHHHQLTICSRRTQGYTCQHEYKQVYPSAFCINPFCWTFCCSLPPYSEQICSACTILFI